MALSGEIDSPVRLSDSELNAACDELRRSASSYVSAKLGSIGERIVAKRMVQRGFIVCKVDDRTMLTRLGMNLETVEGAPKVMFREGVRPYYSFLRSMRRPPEEARLRIADRSEYRYGIPVMRIWSMRGEKYCHIECPHLSRNEVKRIWHVFAEVALDSPVQFLDFLCHKKGGQKILEVKTGRASLSRPQNTLIQKLTKSGFCVEVVRVEIDRKQVLSRLMF